MEIKRQPGRGFYQNALYSSRGERMESQSTAGTTLPDVAAKFTQWPHLLIWKQGFLRGSFRMDVYYFTPNTSFFCFFLGGKLEVREERNVGVPLFGSAALAH